MEEIKDWTLVTKDFADLMVKESELAISGSIDSCESVITRSDKLITLYIPICTALAIYILPKISNLKSFINLIDQNKLFQCAIFCFLISLFGLWQCLLNAKSYTVLGVGSDPEKIVSSAYIDNTLTNDLKYINLCLAICKNAKLRISKNNKNAYDKSKRNNRAVYTLFAFPVCVILLFLYHLCAI